MELLMLIIYNIKQLLPYKKFWSVLYTENIRFVYWWYVLDTVRYVLDTELCNFQYLKKFEKIKNK